jgi:mannose-1-phosphate guanylyltransferase
LFHAIDEFAKVFEAQPHTMLLEPFGRNSAAAIALALYDVHARYGEDAMILVLSADHLIKDEAAFAAAVLEAQTLAAQGQVVIFGIKPDRPWTEYGYIQCHGRNKVERFVEKPDMATAEVFFASGEYYWNAGMFCSKVGVFLTEFGKHAPEISAQAVLSLASARLTLGTKLRQLDILPEQFLKMPSDSIDYAVMEKTDKVAMVPCDFGWSDVGSWNDFGQLYPKDTAGNHVHGAVLLQDCTDCLVHGGERLIAGLGVSNLIIADSQEALLIADRARAPEVRTIVKTLQAQGHPSYRVFPKVYRPWGSFTTLLEGEGYKIKHIFVKPGASLSLQSHQHRSEHWVVVSGIARITNDTRTFDLHYNESTYIPATHRHRLKNPGSEWLVVIEVQCGSYLGEDDITRYEDHYGRVEVLEASVAL